MSAIRFKDKRISSIVSILPKNIARYADELEDYNFPVVQSRRLGMLMDYNTRRESADGECVSDYAFVGINRMISKGCITKDEIDAIVVVSSSQDYIMPSVSYILQGRLGLRENVYCCDIVQVCGGYIYGLIQSFLLMDSLGYNKVLLVTGDMLTKKIGKRDRNSRPIIGDAVNVSIIERSASENDIVACFENYGGLADKIIIPAGGFKHPSDEETRIEKIDESGNYRSAEQFYMDGEAVFNFVMTKVPPLVYKLFAEANQQLDRCDYFMFHQPNKYMVDRLADELEIDHDKMFSNIVGLYGNASTATIPLNICHNIGKEAMSKPLKLCLSGFGAGLTCNAMLIENEKMNLCEIVEYE